jgi:hypothetical protein
VLKIVPPLLLLILGHGAYAIADGNPDPLSYLKDDALAVNVVARVMDSGHVTVWNMKSTKITISGRAVQVRLQGDNVLVLAHLIPYLNEDNSILLVALGQVWMPTEDNKGYRYYSTMKSLPITPGEKVFFFPFGMAVDQKANVYTVELEIQVVPYAELKHDETPKH